jgi:DNA polymerase-3 subunit alpha
MAALLSSEIEDGNKRDIMVDHIGDARRLGVEVLPPNVNTCEPAFTVKDGKILFGLTAIKGLGRGAAEDIVRARQEGGPFKDFFDFCERIDSARVSRAAIEKLIKAGAFDAFGRRAQLWAILPHAIQAASELQEDRRRGQRSLFEPFGEDGPTPAAPIVQLPDLPEWPENERLANEKEALDFYLSSHPLAQHEDDIRRFATHTVSQMPDLADGQEVFMGGMLTGVRFMNSKNARNGNSRYVICQIEDFTGSTKCVMWPDDLARHKDEVHADRICFIKATVNKKRADAVLVMTRIVSVEQAQREQTKGLWLALNLRAHEPPVIDAIARVLQRSPGGCPVFLCFRDGAGKRTLCKASEDFKINAATVAVGELEMLLGPGSVKFAGATNHVPRNGG